MDRSLAVDHRRGPPDVVALARFLDLHDVRAQVREKERAVIPGEQTSEVEDPDPLERPGHSSSSRSSSIPSEAPHHRQVTRSR
jgi:hypothetical protein